MSLSSPLKSLAIAVLFAAGGAGVAFAQDTAVTVRLAAPTTRAHIVADNAVWSCQGDTCQAVLHHDASAHSCSVFARAARGQVVSYGSLSDEDITRCNGAPQTQTAQAGH